MADKVDKPKKKAKPKKDEKGVLAALPSTRPERIGNRRAEPAAPRPRAKSTSNAAKTARPAAAKKPRGAKSAARASTSRATAGPKTAAPHTFEPTQAAESAAKAAPRVEPPAPRPRPVSEGAPGIGTGGTHPDERAPESARPSGAELAGTAVKAAGEVAQLAISIGGHLLKRAVERIPRP